MKSTETSRTTRRTANPRRTTLAHLTDATGPAAAQTRDESAQAPGRPLPQRTANPRRTVLTELPKSPVTS